MPEILGADAALRSLLLLQGMLALAGIAVFLIARRINRRNRLRREMAARGLLGETRLARAGVLPAQAELLAGLGSGGPAARSLDRSILRPAWGLRVLTLGLAGALCAMVLWPELFGMAPTGTGLSPVAGPPGMAALLIAAAGWAVLYIFTFEAAYDSEVLIVTRLFWWRREYRWRDLVRIADDGRYEYVLTFRHGQTAKVLKHAAGSDSFLREASQHLRRT